MNTEARPVISVIVPVFNAARFVLASISSVLDHTAADLEVIAVDDGSTDDSKAVLERLAANDSRVSVIGLGANRGQNAARNAGIDKAKGDYVCFLDADDFVPAGALDLLLSVAVKTQCQLTIGKMLWLKTEPENVCPPIPPMSGDVVTASIQESAYLQWLSGSHCCNLYRRSLLEHPRIRYAVDLSIGADQLFQAATFINAGKVAIIDQIVYVYHHYRSHSVTKRQPTLKSLCDDIEFHRRVANLYLEHELADVALRFLGHWSYSIREYWLQIPAALTRAEALEFFRRFRSMRDEFGIREWDAAAPEHHRHLLELILSGRDDQALAFLATDAARFGFPSAPTPLSSTEPTSG